MKKVVFLVALLAIASTPAAAALNVLACEPEWGVLASELGGERVKVSTATTALQDPHRIEARPSLIARARNADLVVCTGAELEVGWLPVLLRESGNPRVQPGRPGNFEAADFVALLEKPTRVDRAEGDVHPRGNPHIQTDPRNIARVAEALSLRLAEIDPEGAAHYRFRHQAFAKRWSEAVTRWEKQAAPLKGVEVVVQHRAFPYLSEWLGMKEVAVLEPKPGVEPSAAYLAGVLRQLERQPAKMVIRAAYHSPRAAQWLAERAGIQGVILPFTVGGTEQAKDLFGLFDDTLKRLLAGLQ